MYLNQAYPLHHSPSLPFSPPQKNINQFHFFIFINLHKIHPSHSPSFTFSVYLPPNGNLPQLGPVFYVHIDCYMGILLVISHMYAVCFNQINPLYYLLFFITLLPIIQQLSVHEGFTSRHNYLSKAFSPNITTPRIRISAHKFWTNMNSQSDMHSFHFPKYKISLNHESLENLKLQHNQCTGQRKRNS